MIALIAVTCALVAVAVLMVRMLRADRRREATSARSRASLARAYAEIAAAKAAAETRNAQLEATLAGMSDGVMMLDGENRLVQWNDRFAELTGLPRAMLVVGISMAEMIRVQVESGEIPNPQGDVEAEVARRMALIETMRQHVVTERVRPNGQVLELRRNPLPNGGTVTLYSDITARRRAEAAQGEIAAAAAALVEQKAQFIAMVCSEVTAPLDAVLATLDALQRQSGAAPAVALQRARRAADTMAELMRDILDLAELDAGRLALRPTDYVLKTLIEEVAARFAGRAAERGMQLVTEIAPVLPERLHGDAGRVRQVLVNYVSNAIKYAGPGEVRLRASLLDLDQPMLRIAVADRGPAVSPAQAALLFQSFTRLAGAAQARDAAPAGIGLVVCARLARAMGGEVGLVAGAGGGNEFWLTVPLRPAIAPPPPAVATPARAADTAPRHERRRRVLLVEDLLVNQLVIATRLRRDGHHVDLASSGAEALRLATERTYDLVLTDLMMPGMNGFELAHAIRALPDAAGSVPIFALTATDAAEDRARCRAAGMQGMLGKPLDDAALAAALATDRAPAPALPSPAPAPQAAGPRHLLVDAARLRALRAGLPPGQFSALIEQCIAEFRAHLAELRDAIANSEAAAIEACAHAMAGMAGNYGLPALDARMRRIMAAARAADLPAARAASGGIEAELQRTIDALGLLLPVYDG